MTSLTEIPRPSQIRKSASSRGISPLSSFFKLPSETWQWAEASSTPLHPLSRILSRIKPTSTRAVILAHPGIYRSTLWIVAQSLGCQT